MPDTRCAMCDAPIVPAGEAWDHVGEPKPRHPAIPVGEWQTAPEPSGPIEDAEIERILAMSDEEIIAEVRREGLNPELEARYMRKLFENAVEIATLRHALSVFDARDAAQRPLVAAALAWLPEHAEYTAGCATCEALVEAARAHRAAAVDGDTEGA
jgi:hypothetical protein